MAGYNTVEVALFIRASNTTLINQAKNWVKRHVGGSVTRPREFIRDDDPDSQPARFIGIAFTTDPGTAYQIKKLAEGKADAHVRMTLRSRQKLREMIKAELDERGWRVKPRE